MVFIVKLRGARRKIGVQEEKPKLSTNLPSTKPITEQYSNATPWS